ncbi:bacterial cell division membrane protein [Chthonomonas calidirosea]|uniref:FtsW/RodA/SpoVE family cell cycle protein n=1 Tax=Chthonomonas calidirosea TaxID=454171 RepID=UPI0006DD38D5|nr:putative peptidoglycan glycosyltransferase FtsW [Chthonomonas calidirosea]CEK12755.1 bacterial cell division membrane protein [Chthonomonas calidirosea]
MTTSRQPELGLFVTAVILTVIGLWMVLDTSYAQALYNPHLAHDPFFFVKRQALGAFIGFCTLSLLLYTDYRRLRVVAIPALLVGIGLLIAVHIPHVGIRMNGAARWIRLGPLSFQPSEVAKLCLILYVAARLSVPRLESQKEPRRSRRAKTAVSLEHLAPVLLVSLLYLMLIERQPDLGTAFVLFLTLLTQLFLAGVRKRHLLLFTGMIAFLVLITSLFGRASGNRQERILAFLHPQKDLQGIGYQIYHARLAVGSGEWTGLGLGNGREKYYLPQADSDFVFATYAEETGLVGVCILLVLFGIISWRGFAIARYTPDRFGALLAAGLTALITWQAIVNVAVASDSIPATGVPLPFISYGSTSLVLMLADIGLLMNIAQQAALSKRTAVEKISAPPTWEGSS